VVQQVNKEWDINKDTMDSYIMEIRKLKNKFSGLEIHHVVLDDNVGADVLSKLDFDRANIPLGVFVHECITLPSRHQTQVPSLKVLRNLTKRSL
jgi:hypothetical protein